MPRHSKIDEVLRVTKLRTVFPPSQTEAGAAGYRVLSAHSLPDALILLVATKPAVVVLSDELHAVRGTRTAEEFHRLAATRAVVTLPPGFSAFELGEAAQDVLHAVGSHSRRLTES